MFQRMCTPFDPQGVAMWIRTLDAIERMVDETGVIVHYLPRWGSFAFLHDHPRFRALIRRVGGEA